MIHFITPIEKQEITRTNQNQKDEWRREAPPLIFLVLCPKQSLHCYTQKKSATALFFLSVQNFFLTTQQFPKESETWDEVDLEQSSPKNKDVDWSEQLN
jgi:hypothetical protein